MKGEENLNENTDIHFTDEEETVESKKKRKNKNPFSKSEEQEENIVLNQDVAQEEARTTKDEKKGIEKKYETQIKDLMDKLSEENEKYLRLYADFDNFRKRSLRERQESMDYGAVEIIEKLLPVLDNFERAMATEEESEFKKGIQMIFNQLKDTLFSLGVKEIVSVGEKFDPNLHHAVATANEQDVKDDIVTHCLQVGYVYKEKVIRPAMVRVNKL